LTIAAGTTRRSGELVGAGLLVRVALAPTDLNWSRVFDRKVCKISFTVFAAAMQEKIQATGY
jgi:hypothetical protein